MPSCGLTRSNTVFHATRPAIVPGQKAPHCDIRKSFATASRNWRLKNDIPLKQIAADLGISVSTVNFWNSGGA